MASASIQDPSRMHHTENGRTRLGVIPRPRQAISVMLDVSPLLLRSAGVKTYVYHWARALGERAGANSLSLFPFMRRPGNLVHESSVLGPKDTRLRVGLLSAAQLCPFPCLSWLVPEVNVFHASHQVFRPPRKAKLTSTIYDLTCWLIPEMHSARNVKATTRVAEELFRRSEGLIAISECTRADAVRVLGLPPERVEVIYPGIAPAFFNVQRERACEVVRRYHLTKPYVLYVGTIEPRKNLGMLLDAWAELGRGIRDEFDLVIVGPSGWGHHSVYQRLQSAAPGVRYLGYVSEADLPFLTAGATVFTYISLYEGFGLPVAQAMAAGVPVLSSNVSALPEVLGGAGVLVDPRSQQEVHRALERLLLSPSLRCRLAEQSRSRADAFTWEASAKKSWSFFERISA